MSSPIIVTGATGKVGRRIVEALARQDEPVIAVADHLDGADRVPGVEYVEADLTHADEAIRVIRGARAVYLTLPENGPDPLALERKVAHNVIDAAMFENVAHLVVSTVLHADRGNTGVPLIDNKREIEIELEESGVPYTILRPGLFLDTVMHSTPHQRRDHLALPMPAGHPIGAVTASDVAIAAACFLLGEPTNRAFDIHVPGGVRGEDIRRVESRLMERDIRYQELSQDVAGFVKHLDMPPEEQALYVDYLSYIRDGSYLGSPEELQNELSGFQFTPLESFMHDTFPRVRDFDVTEDRRIHSYPGRRAP